MLASEILGWKMVCRCRNNRAAMVQSLSWHTDCNFGLGDKTAASAWGLAQGRGMPHGRGKGWLGGRGCSTTALRPGQTGDLILQVTE